MMIPKPLLIVIEDVGWFRGSRVPGTNEPYRTGLDRMHSVEDYHAVISLARRLNTQILGGFVLSEWDKDGLLQKLPSSTWEGEMWTGCKIDPILISKTGKCIKNHRNELCLAVHGLGHEYWENGISKRSEYHDEQGRMRDTDEVKKHLRMYGELLKASGIQSEFPLFFIPPALKHSFGNAEKGMQKILSGFGVRYVLTVFDKARQYNPPLTPHITEECGVILIERGLSPVNWDHVAPEPRFFFDQPILPLHWANILHADPNQNHTVVESWGEYLNEGVEKHGCLLFPDVTQALSQVIYYHLAEIEDVSGGVVLDITKVKRVTPNHEPGAFYLNLPPSSKIHPHEGFLEPADHIRDGLIRLTPSGQTDTIRIFF